MLQNVFIAELNFDGFILKVTEYSKNFHKYKCKNFIFILILISNKNLSHKHNFTRVNQSSIFARPMLSNLYADLLNQLTRNRSYTKMHL